MPFITVLKNTENAKEVEAVKGLILASTIWYDIFAEGFHFCNMNFLQIPKQITQDLFIIHQ